MDAIPRPPAAPFDQFFEHPENTVVAVTGSDSSVWLQSMLTADVLAPATQAVRTLSLDRLGKIQAELLLLRSPVADWLVLVGGDRKRLLEHLNRYIVMEDIELQAASEQLLSLHGSGVAEHLEALRAIDGVEVGQVDWLTRDDGILLVAPRAMGSVRAYLADRNVSFGDRAEWQRRRIEEGLVAFAQDYDEHDTPGTAGLIEDLVSQTKGCYLGQEVVCKMLMRGAIREQSIRIHFDGAPDVGDEIFSVASDAPVGKVTSATAEPDALNRYWAIGRVKSSAMEPPAAVESGSKHGQICPRARTR